ncbi:MAG: deoxyhypusine synthase family protein [Candidatus Aenigmatarchaeota archaeon]
MHAKQREPGYRKHAAGSKDPIGGSRYMGRAKAIVPLKIRPDMTAAELVEDVYANGSYQGRNLAKAAKLWADAVRDGKCIWLGVSGAATPAGLGGIFAQAIRNGHIDAVCSTGANVYHDLHFAYGLPVRQGAPDIDDEDAARDGTTRIYDIYIRNKETLCMQDAILQTLFPKVEKMLRGAEFYSSATFLNALGKAMLEDKRVKDKEGSFVIAAAECDVPVYLDSHHNSSLGMGLALWEATGRKIRLSAPLDLNEATAYVMRMQPQFNIFVGEGGPRNLIQTLAPTASEIYYMRFKGSEGGGIKFSTADERAGALSGSTFKEAHTWGKYPDASMSDKADVWGDYTITFPLAYAYVRDRASVKEPKRMLKMREECYRSFMKAIMKSSSRMLECHKALLSRLGSLQDAEMAARFKALTGEV